MSILDIEDLINNDPPLIKVMNFIRNSSSIPVDMENLSKGIPLSVFAKGVYSGDVEYTKGLIEELSKHSSKCGLSFLHIDCAQIASMSHGCVWDYLRTITTRPFKYVICIENFECIPSNDEHDQLENLFVHLWESDFLMQRNRFMVIFLSHESQSFEKKCSPLLRSIGELSWLGNLVTACQE